MKQEDLKTMADRCRMIAEGADEFTRRRIIDLAPQYEARSERRSLASRRLGSIAANG